MTESGRSVRGEVGQRAECLLLGIAEEAPAPVIENQDQTPSLREIRAGDDGRRLVAGSFAAVDQKAAGVESANPDAGARTALDELRQRPPRYPLSRKCCDARSDGEPELRSGAAPNALGN